MGQGWPKQQTISTFMVAVREMKFLLSFRSSDGICIVLASKPAGPAIRRIDWTSVQETLDWFSLDWALAQARNTGDFQPKVLRARLSRVVRCELVHRRSVHRGPKYQVQVSGGNIPPLHDWLLPSTWAALNLHRRNFSDCFLSIGDGGALAGSTLCIIGLWRTYNFQVDIIDIFYTIISRNTNVHRYLSRVNRSQVGSTHWVVLTVTHGEATSFIQLQMIWRRTEQFLMLLLIKVIIWYIKITASVLATSQYQP